MSRVKRLQMERELLGDVGHLLPSVQVKCGRVNRAPSCFTSLMGGGVPRTQVEDWSHFSECCLSTSGKQNSTQWRSHFPREVAGSLEIRKYDKIKLT